MSWGSRWVEGAPAYEPLADLITDNGQAINTWIILHEGTILARIGASWDPGRAVCIGSE